MAARQIGRNIAKEIGFGTVDQARITTAISELARNIYLYARAGEIVIEQIEEEEKKEFLLQLLIKDRELMMSGR